MIEYEVEFRGKALKDIKALSPTIARRIEVKIDALSHGLSGDVKRLVNFSPDGGSASAIGACCLRWPDVKSSFMRLYIDRTLIDDGRHDESEI